MCQINSCLKNSGEFRGMFICTLVDTPRSHLNYITFPSVSHHVSEYSDDLATHGGDSGHA